jgi:predicted transcriptional regulator
MRKKDAVLMVRVDREDKEKLKAIAKQHGTSMASIIQNSINTLINNPKRNKKIDEALAEADALQKQAAKMKKRIKVIATG